MASYQTDHHLTIHEVNTLAKFKDALDREWEIRLFAPDITHIRELGCDLSKARTNADILDSLDSVETFGAVLGYLCQEQIEKRGITEKDFARGFDGPARFAAFKALMEAWVNFYQPPAVAAALTKKLPGMFKETETKAIERIEKIFGSNDSATNSPGSAESTPNG